MFGRESEIQQLDNIVRESSNQIALVEVHGVAGIGKSSLIQSYPWKKKGWRLAQGKFEDRRKAEPYSAVLDAINNLLDQQWSVDNKETPTCQLTEFQELLIDHVDILRNILPKVFKLSGRPLEEEAKTHSKTPASQTGALDISSSTDSVHAAFCRIMAFLCSMKPVVLFLDDIHWADRSSFNLLKALNSSQEIKGLIIAISYRDEEVGDGHPVQKKYLQEIRDKKSAGTVTSISLGNLNVEGVSKVVAAMTKTEEEEVLALAEVIHNKTAGNPFFVLQFLQLLQDESFLVYSQFTSRWEWGDVDRLNKVARGISDNVADKFISNLDRQNETADSSFLGRQFLQLQDDESFHESSQFPSRSEFADVERPIASVSSNVADVVTANLDRLPESTQVALKVASCLGKAIHLDLLCAYFDGFFEEDMSGHACSIDLTGINTIGLKNVLQSAVTRGVLIQTVDDNSYMWSHDKLQQNTYSLIPEAIQPLLHLRLGKTLRKMTIADPDAQWMVYMAADQLNRVSNSDKISTGDTLPGIYVAEVNLHAAQLALSKLALFPAMELLNVGVQNVDSEGVDKWIKNYDLCLELYTLVAGVAVQLGKYEDAMAAVQEVEKHAKCLEDKFRSQCTMIVCITSGSDRDYPLGAQKTLEILKLYGEKLPNKLLPGQLFLEHKKLKSKLPGGRLEGLMDLPEMVDARAMKVQKLLLSHLATFAVLVLGPEQKGVGAFATIRALNICCKKGVCSETPMAVLYFAMQLKAEGHYREASEYGEFAIKLVDRFPQKLGSLHGSVRMIAFTALIPATLPFNNTMDGLLEAYRMGLRAGETIRSISATLTYCIAYLSIGLPLGPLQEDLVSYGTEARRLGAPTTIQIFFKILRQTVENMCSTTSKPTFLKGEIMDQDEELARVEGHAMKMTLRDLNTCRLMLACIHNDWKTAEEMVDFLESFLCPDPMGSRGHLRWTYMGLASLVLSRKFGKKKHRNIGKKIMKHFKSEVEKGSVNAHPVLMMLKAESSPSKEGYEKAIKICARLGLVQHEAYLCERAASYFLRAGDSDSAEFYLAQSHSFYTRWGAMGKAHTIQVESASSLFDSYLNKADSSQGRSLKGRRRFSADDSLRMSDVSWSSIPTCLGKGAGESSTSGSGSLPTSGLNEK